MSRLVNDLFEVSELAHHGPEYLLTAVVTLGGALVEVTDVQKPITGLIVHTGRVVSGELGVGDTAQAAIDVPRRRSVSRSHTATHVLHQALRDALSDTATQAGSENSPGRLRFDFSWNKPVPASVFAGIEEHINQVLLDDLPVGAQVMPKKQALELGAQAMFGEKYGEVVRVVELAGPWSRELCGGTHVGRTSQIGLLNLVGEQSVGSGIRRVEALVSADAFAKFAAERALVAGLACAVGVVADGAAAAGWASCLPLPLPVLVHASGSAGLCTGLCHARASAEQSSACTGAGGLRCTSCPSSHCATPKLRNTA